MLKTIFIVDDSAINLTVAKNALKNQYRIRTFYSAVTMFEVLKKIVPDLILLDIEMPIMDGFEALTILKEDALTAEIPVMFLTNLTDSDVEAQCFQMGVVDFVSKPFSVPVLQNRIKTHLEIDEIVNERTANLKNLKNALVFTLADMVESRDKKTGGHISRTSSYMKILIDEMVAQRVYSDEWNKASIDLMISSARLHDVGKVSIPDAILNKPGKLTDDEFTVMKTHCELGNHIIDNIMLRTSDSEFLNHAKLFIGSHHERWDGKGYPLGLAGKDIPLQGRLMAIVDVYDALVSKRSYKDAFTPDEAVEIIMSGAGTQFDPKIAELFFKVKDQFEDVRRSCNAVESASTRRISNNLQAHQAQTIQEPMPYGKVLVVDDVNMNIHVTKNILTPYKLQVDSAQSGFAAIEMINSGNTYDIVFMDHIMPQMDGFETVKRIRDMGYSHPIVALTANTILGQESKFLKGGFDGFISKPIDIRQLNDVLNKFIRDKHIKHKPSQEVTEMTNNSKDIIVQSPLTADPDLNTLFVIEGSGILSELENLFENGISADSESLRAFIIRVHGIKSVLAYMNRTDLSDLAEKLENWGRKNNIEAIYAETPAFLECLRALVSEITLLEEGIDKPCIDKEEEDKEFLLEKLQAIKAVCEDYGDLVIEEALSDLNTKIWSQQTNELLTFVSGQLLLSNFKEIANTIDKYMVEELK